MARVPVAVAFFLLTIVTLTGTAHASPSLQGMFRAGELGVVDVTTSNEGRVVARYKGVGKCPFKPEMQVLSGTFEGDVFLGTVFICQQGPSCEPEKAFPFFAVYHEGALAGDVKLDTGCSSPGLEGRRLNVAVATAEDRLLVSHDDTASAAGIAGKNANQNKKELEKMAKDASILGQLKMKEQNYTAARTAFERAISYDDMDWKTWSYLSQVELKLGNVAKGLESIQKAVLVAPKAKTKLTDQELGDLFYNQACAQSRNSKKKEALTALRNAFRLGDVASLLEAAQTDSDLDFLREDSDFKKVLNDAKQKKDKREKKP